MSNIIIPKERGILMSAPNIPPILDGRKTHTRRELREQPPEWATHAEVLHGGNHWAFWSDGSYSKSIGEWPEDMGGVACPYGVPGDRLWVREAWRTVPKFDGMSPSKIPIHTEIPPLRYEADGAFSGFGFDSGRYRHARFMPRWASRILLEVADVWIERLQDISEEDAIAEGISGSLGNYKDYSGNIEGFAYAVDSYRSLWESINGAGSWDINPWVWVTVFKRIES